MQSVNQTRRTEFGRSDDGEEAEHDADGAEVGEATERVRRDRLRLHLRAKRHRRSAWERQFSYPGPQH